MAPNTEVNSQTECRVGVWESAGMENNKETKSLNIAEVMHIQTQRLLQNAQGMHRSGPIGSPVLRGVVTRPHP